MGGGGQAGVGPGQLLDVQVGQSGEGVCVISLIGELDLSTLAKLERELFSHLRSHGRVVLDLTDLVFIDSTGIGLLIQAFQTNGGDRLNTVISSGSQVERVFNLAGIDRALPLYRSREIAIRELNGC